MKYIKTFERIGKLTNIDLKRYVVWKVGFPSNVLMILESPDTYSKTFERLYSYNPTNIKPLRKLDGGAYVKDFQYKFSDEEIKDHVIYQSDNLDDCLDLELLKSLFNADKYNL